VLVVLVLVSQFTSQKRNATTVGGGFVDVLESFDRGNVTTVKAWLGAKADSSITLERTGDGWTVASAWGWPAKETQMSALFDALDKRKGEKRSSTEDVLADYALDDESGLHLVGSNGANAELFHLIVGKNVRGSNNFVRHAGSPDAYVSNVNLRGTFGLWGEEPKVPAQTSWVDMTLVKVEPGDVDRIAIESDDSSFVLEKVFAMVEPDSAAAAAGAVPTPDRNSYEWKPDGMGDIAKSKADRILNAFRTFNAADVADPDSLVAYGLDAPGKKATITLQNGTESVLHFGRVSSTDENRVYVQVNGGRPAQMWKGTLDRIFVERSSLAPDEDAG
jgi:hypothetical protein